MKLQINNISHHFQSQNKKLAVLENINLEIQPGEFICLVGPSGCGKSTLLNLIAGLEQPQQGEILTQGKVGLMFQEAALFPWLKVKDNVGFGLKMRGWKKEIIQEKVNYFLDLVHLRQFSEAYPHELSGGMKQRVALARTLILEPDILLMDEPFGSLDAQTREILYHELQEIWQLTKTTIIFVTHNVREAACLGDRVQVFTARPGKIKKEFLINFDRPREFSNLEVIKLSTKITAELKSEVAKVVKELENYSRSKNT